ncbi:NUDIX hydrolase [Mesobacillus zeae]|uniref:CoA pyrophosphatase n=1 Tax=Mesobacillus zeae TaxID=1917180 RepID=A0A398BAG2_9BACI|nr:CoA pyrophosphatase [Mesobacillus zeae]RID85838.1 CoA pyrophosphatase [Mesobacillus zeae]
MKIDNLIDRLRSRVPGILGQKDFYRFSVLLPLIKKNGEIHIVFEVRSNTLRRQPGEICFPGGKIEREDYNEKACAIRETSEELGIPEESIRDVIPLDYMVSAFGTIIYPFVGTIDNYESIKPNEDEVGGLFTVPLSFLLNLQPEKYKINYQVKPEDGFPFDLIIGGENYEWQARQLEEHFYLYEGKAIWGLTARILTHFLELVRTNSVLSK